MTNRILRLAAVLLPLLSCTREEELVPVVDGDGEQIVITAGFEQSLPAGVSDTKTYVAGGTEIRWTTSGIDKVIYVFDSSGKKNVFESSSTKAEAVRSFSGTVTTGTTPKYVLWTGSAKNSDNTVLTESSGGLGSEGITSGGSAALDTKAGIANPVARFSGTCLKINPVQTITNQNSFVTDGNISIMKKGDECLKSVFGYLRYRIPVSPLGDYATIKSIKVTADENIAGQVEIDYSGEEPVATIVANGAKSITVNTRWQTRSPAHYEPGLYFAILPAGVYHNVSIEITTFAGAATSQDAATNKPFTIYCRGEVVVERGKYTDLGTLPLEKPVASNPGFKFDTDYFEPYTDPSSGVVSYRIKSSALGWDNSQSQYYVTKAMTDDERFIYFMVQANEFRPSYHSLPTQERSAKILDLETRKIYTFYATDGCYPYLDTKEDKIYYCIRNDERTAAKFYMRDLLNAPGQVPFNFPYKPGSQVDGYVGVGPKGLKTRASGALYPFGFGLSYTTFAYSNLKLSSDKIMPGEGVTVSFDITNTGKYAGDEVAQLYLTDRVSSITVYEKLLRGFERIHLEPGETKTVIMKLGPDAFEMLTLDMERIIEPGLFEINIGSSSEDFRLCSLLVVQDPAHPEKDFRPAPPAISGMLPVTLKAGDAITFPLQITIEFEKCEIEWTSDSKCRYQILMNQGGGQFAPLAELTTEGGLQKPVFDRADYKASDLKILVLEGSGTIKSFDCLAL